MEIKYTIFKLETKEVHVPSTNYYSRSGDSDTDSISLVSECESFETMEEAVEKLNNGYSKGAYIILPTYIISK